MLTLTDRALLQTRIRSEDDDPLQKHTRLEPLDPSRQLDRIAFSRSREINVDWDTVISEDPADTTPYRPGHGVEYIRLDLEERWGFPDGVKTDSDVIQIDQYVKGVDNWMTSFAVPGSTREYWLICRAGMDFPYSRPLFSTVGEYEDYWAMVDAVTAGDEPAMSLEFVDLAPAIIYRQYRELKTLQALGNSLAASADKIIDREVEQLLSPEELDALTSGYLRMRSVKTDVEIKLERLRDRARDLGYYLALADETVTHPDGTKDEIEEGQLYQPYLTEVTWKTLHHRRVLVRRRDLFSRASWVLRIPFYRYHSQRVTRYQKLIPDFDPWIEKERELSQAGFQVYRFERVGDRYITAQGETIEGVVENCEADATFGRRCAVLIPMYEQSLIGGEILSRYMVVRRPRRGIQPIHLPRLFVEEELLFATHFRKVEVGELVESINLAPGEEREIVIEKTTLTEQEMRRTATSISDLTVADRVDLSTEMEREATQSSERTSTKSLSARAGGSYGAFSGSAEGATSSSLTTRQFARDLQKVASKASRSVTRQTRQEVRTSTSVKTNVSTRESTKISILNINEGRSLNLLFYQLYNIYELSLRLDRMRFTLLSGREIIAGSGIVIPEAYSLDQLPVAIERMDLEPFPVRPNADLYLNPDDAKERAREAYQILLVNAIKQTLEEYKKGIPDSSGTIDVGSWDPPDPDDPAYAHVKALVEALNAVQYTGGPIKVPGAPADAGPSMLVVGSPGLYLDTNVGARPGTEPYSEAMRAAELGRRAAEILEINARANYNDAMARRLARIEAGNIVKGRALDLKTLELTFADDPLSGDWELYVADVHITDFRINQPGNTHQISFPKDQQWLNADSVEIARLVHKELRQELTFLI